MEKMIVAKGKFESFNYAGGESVETSQAPASLASAGQGITNWVVVLKSTAAS